jgi:sec-independent protein translocase protein TatC
MSSTTALTDDGRMTLVEHLTELRNRLIKCVVAVGLCAIVAFFLYQDIFDFLLKPYCDLQLNDCKLLQTDPLEGFSVRLKVTTYAGIARAMPVLLWQIWRFVTPGLYEHERRYAIPFVVSSIVLFFLGAGLAYFTLPKALEFLSTIGGNNLETQFRPLPYFQLVSYMMLAFGIGFEFPILLVFLQLAGIVQPGTLGRYRRHAVVGITVLVAVITPSGDPYSLAVLSVPMYIFFEASILIGRIAARRKRRREDAAAS